MKKDDDEKPIKTQSNVTFIEIDKPDTIYDSYTFKHKEALVDKLIYLGFVVLESSKLLRYETFFDKL